MLGIGFGCGLVENFEFRTTVIKLKVGKSCNRTFCKDLTVGGWKLEVESDPDTGKTYYSKYFAGQEKMEVKEEQMYLGDVISSNGKHLKNVLNRKSKGLGVINQIMQILNSTFFGKFHFEVALVERASHYLPSCSTQRPGST